MRRLRTAQIVGMATLAVSSVTAFVGCQEEGKDDGSEVDSLDQFAGSRAVHMCTGPFDGNKDYYKYFEGLSTAEQKAAVEDSLSAVPTGLKQQFFFKVNSAIILTANPTAQCRNTSIGDSQANGANGTALLACHKIEDGQVKIIISNKPDHIRTSLLRAFAYYYAEVDSRIDLSLSENGSANLIKPFEAPDLLDAKLDVGLAFLNDVAASKEFKLKSFKGLLHPSVLKEDDPAATRGQAWKALTGFDFTAKELFSNYVIAEAFDSYYCNANTRTYMFSTFKGTANALGLSSARGSNLTEDSAGFGLAGAAKAPPVGVRKLTPASKQNGFPQLFSTASQATPATTKPATGAAPRTTTAQAATTAATAVSRKPVYKVPTTDQIYNPETMAAITTKEGAAAATAKGATPIKYTAGDKTYSGYSNGGSWAQDASGNFKWINKDATKPNDLTSIAKLDPATGKWDYKNPVLYNEKGEPLAGEALTKAKENYTAGQSGNIIALTADRSRYVGYNSGHFEANKDGTYQWFNNKNEKVDGAVATYDAGKKSWTTAPAKDPAQLTIPAAPATAVVPTTAYGVPGGQIGPAEAPVTTAKTAEYGVPGGQIGPAEDNSQKYGVPGGLIGPPALGPTTTAGADLDAVPSAVQSDTNSIVSPLPTTQEYGVPGGQIGPAEAPVTTPTTTQEYGVPGGQIGPAEAPVTETPTQTTTEYGVPGGQIGPAAELWNGEDAVDIDLDQYIDQEPTEE